MAQGKFISYLRVSTVRQGASGLGLEAQRKAVEDYLNGGQWTLIEEVIEVESAVEMRENTHELVPTVEEQSLGAILCRGSVDGLPRTRHRITDNPDLKRMMP
ncbi:recombinase family protein [Methylorubrum extorquens]